MSRMHWADGCGGCGPGRGTAGRRSFSEQDLRARHQCRQALPFPGAVGCRLFQMPHHRSPSLAAEQKSLEGPRWADPSPSQCLVMMWDHPRPGLRSPAVLLSALWWCAICLESQKPGWVLLEPQFCRVGGARFSDGKQDNRGSGVESHRRGLETGSASAMVALLHMRGSVAVEVMWSVRRRECVCSGVQHTCRREPVCASVCVHVGSKHTRVRVCLRAPTTPCCLDVISGTFYHGSTCATSDHGDLSPPHLWPPGALAQTSLWPLPLEPGRSRG